MVTEIHNPQSTIQNLRLSLIVAMSQNRVIGRNNQLPWHLPADLRHFKQLTVDHAVIMGRKTFESIGCKPLPGRTNIVVTRDQAANFTGTLVAHDLRQAIALGMEHDRRQHHQNEIFILGGSEIFRAAIVHAHRIYLTLVETDLEGDTLFPEIDRAQWNIISDEPHAQDEKNAHPCRFQILEKMNAPASPA